MVLQPPPSGTDSLGDLLVDLSPNNETNGPIAGAKGAQRKSHFLTCRGPCRHRPSSDPHSDRSLYLPDRVNQLKNQEGLFTTVAPPAPLSPANVLRVRVVQVVGRSGSAQRVEVRAVGGVVRVEEASAVAAGAKGRSPVARRRHRRTVDVQAGVLLLPLCAAVLEPDLHLEEEEEGMN